MLFVIVATIVFLSDQFTKFLIKRDLNLGESVRVLDGYFHVTYVRNPGGAFGIFPRSQLFFLGASIAVVVAIIIYKFKDRPKEPLVNIALGMIFGGTFGNLVDRYLYGEVVDWLDFRVWPVFNVADIALVVGLALLSIKIVMSNQGEDSRKTN